MQVCITILSRETPVTIGYRQWRFFASIRVGFKSLLPEIGAVVGLNGEFVHIVQLGANHLQGTQLHGKE